MPAAPFVGAVTTRPPEAFSSFTASANACSHSVEVSRRCSSRSYSSSRRRTSGARRFTRNPPGRVPSVASPCVTHVGHGGPDGVEPCVDALLAVHGDLVEPGDIAERDAVLVAELEQFGCVRVRQWMPQRLGLLGSVALAADEPAADRVVRLFGEGECVVVAPGLQGHGVRVPGKARARLEGDIGLRHPHRVATQQANLGARVAEAQPGSAHVVWVAVVRFEAGETRDDGVGRAMAEARGAEGPVERARDARDTFERAVGIEPLDERTRGPHRADGVRTRRADPDREEIEGRDERCHASRVRRRSRTHPASHRRIVREPARARATAASARRA